jgi:dienelactone hydrolase
LLAQDDRNGRSRLPKRHRACYIAEMRSLVLVLLLVLTARAVDTGPWDLGALRQAPRVEWGERADLVQALFYEGEPFDGKPTRIFAYLARPEGEGPFPAMVLVHGGGGRAFKDWAEHWARRGYVALAMDTAGHGKDKARLPDGGPDQDDGTKFHPFTDAEVREMWTYHAVAAVIRGHSLLASLPEADAARVGITGISWGGYLTCIVAGLDDRLKVAVPVYGCGFLGDNSYWKDGNFDPMPPDLRERWLRNFDPSRYLAGVRCPILFLNGTNDFAYPLDSMRKSYELVDEKLRNISIIVEMKHGHLWQFPEVDAFADAALRGGRKFAHLAPAKVAGGLASCTVDDAVASACLHFTVDSGEWQKRVWQTVPAETTSRGVVAPLPLGSVNFFLSGIDSQGRRSTSPPTEARIERPNEMTPGEVVGLVVRTAEICGLAAAKADGLIATLLAGQPAEVVAATTAWVEKNIDSIRGTARWDGKAPDWGRFTLKAAEKSARLDGVPDVPKAGQPRTVFAHVLRAPESGEIAVDFPAEKITSCRALSEAGAPVAYRADGEKTIIALPKTRDPIDTVLEIALAP